LFAPAATPADVVARLNTEATRILTLPEVRKAMNAAGLVASVSTPQALGQLVRDDIERWTQVVKSGVRFS
jgi:tripartite-type tricarboxylate transporter receptor subunit TctC